VETLLGWKGGGVFFMKGKNGGDSDKDVLSVIPCEGGGCTAWFLIEKYSGA